MGRVVRAGMVMIAILLVGCGGEEEATGETEAEGLRVTLWSQGIDAGEHRRWDLACDPPGGSLPDPAAACGALAAAEDPWAPVPPGTSCAQVFLGPEVLEVTGRFAGAPVSARFTRTDSCEDVRYQRIVAALGLPGAA